MAPGNFDIVINQLAFTKLANTQIKLQHTQGD